MAATEKTVCTCGDIEMCDVCHPVTIVRGTDGREHAVITTKEQLN